MAYIDDPQTQKANLNYIKISMKEPLLEKEDELELARKWRDDQDEKSLHRLVRSYTRLVVSNAAKFKHYGLPMGDLIQEGNIGLMQAANRFEPARGHRFSTYATWWIRSSMQDYVLRNWSIVRTGTTAAQKSLFFNLRRLRAQIEGEKEKEGLNIVDRTKIAEELGVRLKDVEEMEARMASNDQSLNTKIGDEDGKDEIQNFLADDRPTPEDVAQSAQDTQTRSIWLEGALNDLTDREQIIIRERHLGRDSQTLEQLGTVLGVSKERIRQLEQRAMEKLKSSMEKHVRQKDELFFEN